MRRVTLILLCSSACLAYADENDLLDLSLEELANLQVSVGQHSWQRSLRDTPVPIDIVTGTQLLRSGAHDLPSALQRLLPYFNFPRPNISDGSDHQRPYSLRGLAPDQILVLLNGRRWHGGAMLNVNNSLGRGSSSVDLSAIPIISIARVEVLRDAAAAQYGSDAIAGIINIILREDSAQLLHAGGGVTEIGDGQQQYASAYFSHNMDSWQFQATLDLANNDATNHAAPDGRAPYFDGDARNDDPAVLQRITLHHGAPDSDGHSLMLQAEQSGNGPLWFGYTMWHERQSEAGAFFRLAKDNRTVRAFYPDGFLPLIEADITDQGSVIGLKNDQTDLPWAMTISFGANRFQFGVHDSNNASMGLASPTQFDSGELYSSELIAEAQSHYRFDWSTLYPLRSAYGLQWRQERFRIGAGDEASWEYGGVPVLDGPNAGAITVAGAQGFPGFKPENEVDKLRASNAAWLELEQPLPDGWLTQLALRYEQHEGFGNTTDGKLALGYQINNAWFTHASFSSGFRAPSLQQIYYSATATSFIGGVPFEIGHFPVDDALARELGATDLKPEKSRHTSVGVSYQPNTQWWMDIDAYRTTIDDRISLSGTINQDPALFGPEIVAILQNYGVGAARFFTNAVDLETRGLDSKLRWQPETTWFNRNEFALSYHHHHNRISHINSAPLILQNVGNILFDSAEKTRIVSSQPETEIMLDWSQEKNRWSLLLREIYVADIEISLNTNNRITNQNLRANYFTDLELGWRYSPRWQFSLGINNVFNQYPERLEALPGNALVGSGRSAQYSQQSPFGYDGAFYYLRLSIGF